MQLAVFIHENAHWYIGDDKKQEEEKEVIRLLKRLHPNPPEPEQKNLYHHIMVEWITYDALIELFGKKQAQAIIDRKVVYYTRDNPNSSLSRNFIWYINVAIDSAYEVGKIMSEFGFNINPHKGIVIN